METPDYTDFRFGTPDDIKKQTKPPFNFAGNKSYMRDEMSGLFKWLYYHRKIKRGRFVVADVFGGSLYVAHIAQHTFRKAVDVDVVASDYDGYIDQFNQVMYRCLEEVRQFILASEPDIKREQPLQKTTAEGVLRILARYPEDIARHVQSKLNCYGCRGGLSTMRMRLSTVSPQKQIDICEYLGGVHIARGVDYHDFVKMVLSEHDPDDTIVWVLDPPYHKHTSRLGYASNKDIPIPEIVNYIEEQSTSNANAFVTFGYEYFKPSDTCYLWGLYLKHPAMMQRVFRLEYGHLILSSKDAFPPYPAIPTYPQNITEYMLKKHGNKVMCPPGTPDFE